MGADVFIGLSVKGALTQDMVRTMAPNPIIFAMANPDPEITPEEVRAVRSDAILVPGARTIPIRSTTSWASPTTTAGRWTCGPDGSTTR